MKLSVFKVFCNIKKINIGLLWDFCRFIVDSICYTLPVNTNLLGVLLLLSLYILHILQHYIKKSRAVFYRGNTALFTSTHIFLLSKHSNNSNNILHNFPSPKLCTSTMNVDLYFASGANKCRAPPKR